MTNNENVFESYNKIFKKNKKCPGTIFWKFVCSMLRYANFTTFQPDVVNYQLCVEVASVVYKVVKDEFPRFGLVTEYNNH